MTAVLYGIDRQQCEKTSGYKHYSVTFRKSNLTLFVNMWYNLLFVVG